MRILLLICLFSFLLACSETKMEKTDFLVGTWKMEGKDLYEVWEKNENNEFTGYSYELQKNKKTITETLSLKRIDDRIVYEATVSNQNEGKTIQFVLNTEVKTYFSFENDQHDFPKKIQYKKISNDEIQVRVLGDEGKGFFYTLFKQK